MNAEDKPYDYTKFKHCREGTFDCNAFCRGYLLRPFFGGTCVTIIRTPVVAFRKQNVISIQKCCCFAPTHAGNSFASVLMTVVFIHPLILTESHLDGLDFELRPSRSVALPPIPICDPVPLAQPQKHYCISPADPMVVTQYWHFPARCNRSWCDWREEPNFRNGSVQIVKYYTKLFLTNFFDINCSPTRLRYVPAICSIPKSGNRWIWPTKSTVGRTKAEKVSVTVGRR